MGACQYGSEKQPNAVDFINPTQIGALCFLVGLEGSLCRLLDLVPSAIKKIASLDPNAGNADEVFGDLLKQVAKTSYKIVIDEATGQIPTSSFCAVDPPPQPEDITFSDVYIFIADLVPILNRFFAVSAILSGDSSTLLTKIMGFWLRQQWFKNCQCKRKDPTPSQAAPYYQNPLITLDPSSLPDPTSPSMPPPCVGIDVTAANEYITSVNTDNQRSAQAAQDSNDNSPDVGAAGDTLQANLGSDWTVTHEPPAQSTVCPKPVTGTFTKSYGCFNLLGFSEYFVTCIIDNGQFKVVRNSDQYTYYVSAPVTVKSTPYKITLTPDFSNCCKPVPPPDVTPPPRFCQLFPYDPLCVVPPPPPPPPPTNECESNSDDILVCLFTSCNQFRSYKYVKLFKSGDPEQIAVSKFSSCGAARITETVELLNCQPSPPPPPPPSPCSQFESEIRAIAIDKATNGQKYIGYYVPYTAGDLSSALIEMHTNGDYYNNPDCQSQIDKWFTDAWNTYWSQFGCTDPNALNYSDVASKNDGSCTYAGCTDPTATNYNPNASQDDGSCNYT